MVFRAGEVEKTVGVQYLANGWEMFIDDQFATAAGTLHDESTLALTIDSRRCAATVVRVGDSEHVFMNGRRDVLTHADPLTSTAAAEAGPAGLRSPMPGRVIELIATVGTELPKGAPLLVLEAMKIEHTVVAPSAGTLRAFKVAAGEQVGEGTELVDFLPAHSR